MQTPKLLRATPGLRTGNVRIGSTHAYSFNGDQVRLDAELLADAPASLSGRDWALQLWACAAPFVGHPTAGTLVAQIPLDTLIAEPLQYVGAETPGFPPAGHGSHAMVLVLAAGHDGCFDEVHDYANYPLAESFTQPEINGSARFELGDKTVTVSADGITNPRAADNLSGTLSLELWALTSPYTGGTPAGVQLAASQLGNLGGQQAWHNINAEHPLAATPAGTWHIALLLREWASTGFVTRDYVNFPLPVSWPEAETKAVAEVKAEASPAATATPSAAPKAAPKAEPKAAPKTAPNAAKAAKTAKAAPVGVSVNTASAAELAAIKGLPKAVAAAIVAARPFSSLDELLTLKGIGIKLLDKLKANLSL